MHKSHALFPCSFYTFSRMIEVKEIVVVCDPSYKDIFEGLHLQPLILMQPFFPYLLVYFQFSLALILLFLQLPIIFSLNFIVNRFIYLERTLLLL